MKPTLFENEKMKIWDAKMTKSDVWDAGAVIFHFSVLAVSFSLFSILIYFGHEIAVPLAGRQAGRPRYFLFLCPISIDFTSIYT